MLDEPLTDELLRELLLFLSLLEALFVALGIEVARGVWGMYLIDEIDCAVLTLAELILRVYKNEASLTCHLLSTSEEGIGVRL